MKNLFKKEDGATLVVVAILFTIIVAMVGVVIDFGRGYTLKAQMQSACDLAAMSGAKELPDTSKAVSVARNVARQNGVNDDDIEISIEDGTKIKVDAAKKEKTYFFAAVGINDMNVSCHATAQKREADVEKDFDYAIFSGSKTYPMRMTGSGHQVAGRIHSNNTVEGGGIQFYEASSLHGGNFSWDTKRITSSDVVKDASGKVTIDPNAGTVINPYTPVASSYVEMPYYLGDSIESLVYIPTMPGDSYWGNTVFMWKSWQTINGEQNLPELLSNGKNTKIESPTMDTYMPYAFSTNNDMQIRAWYYNSTYCGVFNKQIQEFRVQTNSYSVINADIYVYNTCGDDHCTMLYFANGATINGNIYCMHGSVGIGGNNVKVNGNIYSELDIYTDGGPDLQINSDYIYAGRHIGISNGCQINGVVVAGKNITMKGGQFNITNTNGTLSLYSKKGNITMENTTDLYGYIFAPYGHITMKGSHATVYGKIIGDEVELTNTTKVYPTVREMPYSTSDASDVLTTRDKTEGTMIDLVE